MHAIVVAGIHLGNGMNLPNAQRDGGNVRAGSTARCGGAAQIPDSLTVVMAAGERLKADAAKLGIATEPERLERCSRPLA